MLEWYNCFMNIEEQNSEIITQLVALNTSIKEQNSRMHILGTGVIYGIGFFIGSAILATIALGIFGPMVGKISWVNDNFTRGTTILQAR